jgi:hypothetical protein
LALGTFNIPFHKLRILRIRQILSCLIRRSPNWWKSDGRSGVRGKGPTCNILGENWSEIERASTEKAETLTTSKGVAPQDDTLTAKEVPGATFVDESAARPGAHGSQKGQNLRWDCRNERGALGGPATKDSQTFSKPRKKHKLATGGGSKETAALRFMHRVLSAHQRELDLRIKNTAAQRIVTKRKKKQSEFQAQRELERQAQRQCLQIRKPSSRPQPHDDPPQGVEGPSEERVSLGEGVGNADEKGGAGAFTGSSETAERGPAADQRQMRTREEEPPNESVVQVCEARSYFVEAEVKLTAESYP